MASSPETIAYIEEQSARAGEIRSRRMFGEYALYCDDKVVAFICDDRLFLKITEAGEAYLDELEYGTPYPGAKPYFDISPDRWDDHMWLSELIRLTADELPLPKPKVKKPRKART